jgi:hypothetical protein
MSSSRFSGSSIEEKRRAEEAGRRGGQKSRRPPPAWHQPCLELLRKRLGRENRLRSEASSPFAPRHVTPLCFGDEIGQPLRRWKYNFLAVAKVLQPDLKAEGYDVSVNRIRALLTRTFWRSTPLK